MANFYDELAPFYHLIYPDWQASVARQAQALHRIISQHWPTTAGVLDVACGIGTQSLGLAQLGYRLRASDLSAQEIEQARAQAHTLQLDIDFSVADMRQVFEYHGGGFDLVLCADNSLPHLLTDADILLALRQMHQCLIPGGGCVITLRDYATEPRGRNIVKPYGVRLEGDLRHLVFQVWDFDADVYELTMFIVTENLSTGMVQTRSMRSRYYAVSTDTVMELMRLAGFDAVQRLDEVFFQPVLVGTRSV